MCRYCVTHFSSLQKNKVVNQVLSFTEFLELFLLSSLCSSVVLSLSHIHVSFSLLLWTILIGYVQLLEHYYILHYWPISYGVFVLLSISTLWYELLFLLFDIYSLDCKKKYLKVEWEMVSFNFLGISSNCCNCCFSS
jgi:hypothetical protein